MQKHPNNRHLWKQINSHSTASLLPIFPSLRYPSPKLAAASFRHSLPQALCSQERSHDSFSHGDKRGNATETIYLEAGQTSA